MSAARLPALLFAALLAAPALPQGAPDAGPSSAHRRLADAAARVQQAHERADRTALTDARAAAVELSRALELDYPPCPESRALRLDLYARLAELFLAGDEPRRALESANRGLGEDRGAAPDALTAQLHLREGEAREALGDDAGAVDAYGKAIDIARGLLSGGAAQ